MDFDDPSFRELLDALHDGVYITDADGITLKVNSAYERLTGLRSEDVVGQHMQALVEQGVISQSVSLRVLKEGRALSLMQSVSQGKRLLVSGTPIFTAEGQVRYVVSTVRDMTELLRMKHERDELQQLKQLRNSTARLHAGQRDDLLDASPVADHPASGRVFAQARQVAASDVKVLLQGETGVGKTLIAQYIHKSSPRAAQPFLALNCGALPENLIEAELFGYVPGAFTGAGSKGKRGLLELAHHGTVFLDEIGDLPLALQVKLLKVIEESRFIPVGGLELKEVDVRIITATHHDLRAMVGDGRFRADLYYRLNVVPIHIPALRERREEIQPLLDFYLTEFNQRYGRQLEWGLEALDALTDYSWPGNIRELINLVERLVVTCSGAVVELFDLPEEMRNSERDASDDSLLPLRKQVEQLERRLIRNALVQHKTTREAARVLGMSQATLVQKMKRWEQG
ncbi:PAS domain S-box-containing protein [Pseudomonas sp. BIGb0408]|uniref:HTH-type transcriptional regulatory protein TyrR n=1 Tax=Phytopseudomonas flavescens TaxID=29435 RepID=A0A7Y9XU67_9GAMM|nr:MULTISPECIES: sigma 54-interacting transcriptional regulator [Pseudomonas]MCW2294442.1 PAS domain S-box-containing protein [Pseudomonas sp. BIGb0408]NYH76284.1 PAS domain S-box-containing protein [Pseudomonas flavescens]